MVESRDNQKANRTARHRRFEAVAVAGAVLVIAAAAVFGASALGTVSGRISGSTNNESNVFTAGHVELRVDGGADLLFDVDGLYPGLMLQRCITIGYVGSIDDVDIRLSARYSGSDGLERFVETTITLGSGSDPDCTDYVASSTLTEGLLADLWSDHPDFTSGLKVAAGVDTDFETTMRVTASVVDDNAAQGLVTDFWVILEARP